MSRPMTSASGSGSRFQQGMEVPSAQLSRDRVGVTPVDVKSPEDLDGMVVNVEILEFPEGGEYAVGRVIEILGRPDDFGVDVEIMIRKHHIPHHFPTEGFGAGAKLFQCDSRR